MLVVLFALCTISTTITNTGLKELVRSIVEQIVHDKQPRILETPASRNCFACVLYIYIA